MLDAAIAGDRPWTTPLLVDWARVAPVGLGVVAAVTLLGCPFPGNMLVLLLFATVVLALVAPAAGLGLLLGVLPLQSVVAVPVGAIVFTPVEALLAGNILAWLLAWPARRPPFPAAMRGVAVCFAAAVVAVALSIANARQVGEWSNELSQWWSAFAIFVVAATAPRGPTTARLVVVGVAVGTIGAAVYGCYQVVAGLGPTPYNVGGVLRAFATFGHPNLFAGYLGVSVPLLAAVAGAGLLPGPGVAAGATFGRAVSILAGCAAAAGAVALGLTQSRGGWLGVAVGLAAVALLLGGRVRWVSLVVCAVGLAVGSVTPVGERVAARVGTGAGDLGLEVQVTAENFAIQERIAHWRAGLAMARDHPWLGVGAGNFPERFREYTPTWRFRDPRRHAHNAYIHVAAQSGSVGLATYLTLLGAVGVGLTTRLRRTRARHGADVDRTLVIAAIGVTLAFCVHNLVDYMHIRGLGLQLSALWALALATSGDGKGGSAMTGNGPGARAAW